MSGETLVLGGFAAVADGWNLACKRPIDDMREHSDAGFTLLELMIAEGSDAIGAITDGCNPTGVAAALFSSYYASNQPLSGGLTGSRWFFTNTLGTIYSSGADDFDAEDLGNKPPSAGTVLQ